MIISIRRSGSRDLMCSNVENKLKIHRWFDGIPPRYFRLGRLMTAAWISPVYVGFPLKEEFPAEIRKKSIFTRFPIVCIIRGAVICLY